LDRRITIPPILSLARAGATSRAWEAFVAAGLDGAEDINALTLKGRLLKDRARQAAGAERKALFAQSGAAYAAAATLRPDSYPLINAAAMALFAGDGASAAAIARDALTLIDGDPAQGETPYWREATRAEAMLLLGREQDAKTSLATAMTLAPQAWEDHASTLRQFAAILGQTGGGASWLDQLRPAPSLHYSGILGIAPDDAEAHAAIQTAIAQIAPGAGYGALAAGADIIVAETLVAAGAELHIVLPIAADDFRLSSVDPFGFEWGPRYAAMLDQASSVTICSDDDGIDRAAIALSDYQAMGLAAERALLLESRAVALRVEPADRTAISDPWLHSGRDIIYVPVCEQASRRTNAPLNDGQLLFITALSGDADHAEPMGFALLADAIASISATASTAAIDCRRDGNRRIAATLLSNAAPGTIIASSAAAMAVMAEGCAAHIEPLGEMETADGPTGIYAVKLKALP
jgi:hypothetical protein